MIDSNHITKVKWKVNLLIKKVTFMQKKMVIVQHMRQCKI